MINNPKLIEKIKKQIKNTTKEQLQEAIKLADEEYNEQNNNIKIEETSTYYVEERYTVFNVHRNKTSRILNIFRKNKEKELEEAA